MNLSLAEWVSVLKLSTMWEFTGPRQYAINQIPKLGISPARQINLARDYHIQEWLLPGLIAYAQQQDAITADDVELLGWDFVLKLLQARERMGNFGFTHKDEYLWYIPTVEARVIHDFTTSIGEVFGDEIERVRQICAGRSIGQMLHQDPPKSVLRPGLANTQNVRTLLRHSCPNSRQASTQGRSVSEFSAGLRFFFSGSDDCFRGIVANHHSPPSENVVRQR
jgi:hypothetical protein